MDQYDDYFAEEEAICHTTTKYFHIQDSDSDQQAGSEFEDLSALFDSTYVQWGMVGSGHTDPDLLTY